MISPRRVSAELRRAAVKVAPGRRDARLLLCFRASLSGCTPGLIEYAPEELVERIPIPLRALWQDSQLVAQLRDVTAAARPAARPASQCGAVSPTEFQELTAHLH